MSVFNHMNIRNIPSFKKYTNFIISFSEVKAIFTATKDLKVLSTENKIVRKSFL